MNIQLKKKFLFLVTVPMEFRLSPVLDTSGLRLDARQRLLRDRISTGVDNCQGEKDVGRYLGWRRRGYERRTCAQFPPSRSARGTYPLAHILQQNSQGGLPLRIAGGVIER